MLYPTKTYHYSAIPYGPETDWNYWFGTVTKGAKTGKGTQNTLIQNLKNKIKVTEKLG